MQTTFPFEHYVRKVEEALDLLLEDYYHGRYENYPRLDYEGEITLLAETFKKHTGKHYRRTIRQNEYTWKNGDAVHVDVRNSWGEEWLD